MHTGRVPNSDSMAQVVFSKAMLRQDTVHAPHMEIESTCPIFLPVHQTAMKVRVSNRRGDKESVVR
jgi:hypothetical protein